ncbi:MAG: tetratricopeptide repeat protein, partial [Planctomycetaceae bacterium]
REPEAQPPHDRVARERPQGLSEHRATLAWRVESQLDEPSRAIDAYLKQAEGFGEGGQKVRAALMLMGRGETGPEVEQLLLDACELEPQASAPWEWIVRYYIQRTRLLAARDKIDEAEQALPDDPPFLKPRTLARCYRLLARAGKDQAEQQRAAEQAERHYTAAVDAAPDSMSLYRERTEYFIETNQFDKARQSLAKVLDPQLNVPREVRLWAEHSTALVTASGGTFDDLTRGLELLRAAEVDTVEQRIFNLRSQLDVLARRNRVADRKEMVRLLEQLREVAGVRFTLNEQLQLAALYEAAGDWPKAEAEFETLLNPDPPQSGPRDPAVIAGYALAMLRQKGPFDDERIERLNRFVEELKQLAPGALETALIEARLLHAQGRSAEAVPVLLAYLDTLNVQAPEASLRNLIEQKDVDRAVELLKAALRSRKDEGLARVVPHLEGLLRQQNTEEALSVLERYLSVSELAVSVQTEMLRVVAGLLEEVGETRAAEDLLRKYVAKAPQPAEAAMALVGFLGRQDRIDEALDKCEQVWNMLADPTRAAENSVALVRHGKPTDRQISRVEQLLLDAIKRSQDPKVRVQYQIFVADLRDVQLRTDEAVQIYEAILKVNDRDLVALNNLAWMLAFQPGREAQALTLINRAIELAGPAPAFRDTRASISLRLNKPQQAVDDLVEAIDQAGDDPELWFHLSQAYLQTGDREQAREAFRNAEGKGLKLESLHRLQHDGYRKLQQEFGEKQSDSVTWSENP